MQIHELTSKRPVNEGVLGALGAAASGVADVASRAVMQKYNPSNADDTVAVGARQGAATTMNQALVKPLADSMTKSWTTGTLPHLMAASGAAEPGAVDQTALKDALEKQIKMMIKADYNTVKVDPASMGGEAVELAQKAKDAITSAVQKIVTYPPAGSGRAKSKQTVAAEFAELAKAISAIQSIMQFYGKSAGAGVDVKIDTATGKYTFDGQPFNPSDPSHVEAFSKIQAANGVKKA